MNGLFRVFDILKACLGPAGLALACTLAFSGLASAHEFKLGDLEIVHPWSRAIPQGAKVASGYFIVKNHGASADRLVSVTGEIAGKTGIHEMAVDSAGVMTMRPLADGIEIPPGGEIRLEPKAMHVMFEELTRAPKEGEKFSGTLTFEKAGTVKVEFVVSPVGDDMDDMQDMDHDSQAG